MKVGFIGGPLNGETLEVSEINRFFYYDFPQPFLMPFDDSGPQTRVVRTCYRTVDKNEHAIPLDSLVLGIYDQCSVFYVLHKYEDISL